MLHANLAGIDRLGQSGLSPSPALFLSALLGPGVEDAALERHRDGIPYMQALDAACAGFLEEFCKVVSIPGRTGGQLRGILALQPSLHRMPPRRPASLVARPDFADAMSYLCLMARTREENRPVRQWWEAFLANPSTALAAQPNGAPEKRHRKKRRRRRPAVAVAAAG
jgi:poly(A) polymerase